MFFIQSSLKSYFYILGKSGELVWSFDYDIYGRPKNVKANGLSNQNGQALMYEIIRKK